MKPIIQGLWVGKIGVLERLSIASFLAHGHDYHLYTYEDQANLPPGCITMDANAILPKSAIFHHTHGQAKGGLTGFSNLFRYRLLEQKGGWWCDMDIICLKPFAFTRDMVLASERHWLWRRKWSNAVICCPAGHALMQSCYRDAAAIDKNRMRFAQCGASLLRRHARKLGLSCYVEPPQSFNPINWWESSRIAQPGSSHRISPDSYAVHCYSESWRWRLQDQHEQQFRNHIFPPASLLGELQRRYLPDAL